MVKRGIYILLLVSLLVGAMLAGHLGAFPMRARAVTDWVAVAIAVATGGVGLLGMITLRRRCNAMSISLRKMIEGNSLMAVDCPDRDMAGALGTVNELRSERRRGGEECRTWGSPEHLK